jgi:TATA-binding protein-associated factor
LRRFLSSLTQADRDSPNWEVRHGAGVGLREIFKTHAKGAGKTVGATAEQLERQNRACLQDYALRLLCVFALDRFGDYISDQMTAPVRETCAQALGAFSPLLIGFDCLL